MSNVFEVMSNRDMDLREACDYIAASLRLNEGPVNLNGVMECPVKLVGDRWMVWLPTYSWISIISLLEQFEEEAKENRHGNKNP